MPTLHLITHQIGKFFSQLLERYNNIDFSFSEKHILILLGSHGCQITIMHANQIIDALFVNTADFNPASYNKFLHTYIGYKVFIILDKPNINIDHSDIPVSQGLIYQNPITHFIKNKFSPDILVSSNVYSITRNEQEIWNTIFASTPITNEIQEWLDYLTSNNFELQNIYFFNLNAPKLINSILANAKLDATTNLRLFITVTSSSSIRIIICDQQNIIENYTFNIPDGKTDAYIQGTIEQAVIDSLISLKNHIHHTQVKPCLIVLVNKNLKTLLQQSNFNIEQVAILSDEDFKIQTKSKVNLGPFSDNIILNFLNKNLNYPAHQETIDTFRRITKFNKFLSKPWYLLITSLALILTFTQIKILIQDHQTSSLNNKFYILSKDYRDLRKDFPEIESLEQIVNFHYALTELTAPQKLPFDDLDKLYTNISKNFTLNHIHWELDNDKKSYIVTKGKYKIASSSFNQAILNLENEISSLRKKILNCQIEYEYNINDVIDHDQTFTIPFKIVITK